MGNREDSATAIRKGFKYIEDADWPDTPHCRWTRAHTASRLHLGLANDEMRLGRLLEAAADIELAENYIPEMESEFPASPFLKEQVAFIAQVTGELAVLTGDFNAAIGKFIQSRDAYFELVKSNSGFPGYLAGYLESSQVIAETCLKNHDVSRALATSKQLSDAIKSLPMETRNHPMVIEAQGKLELLLKQHQDQSTTDSLDSPCGSGP